MIKFILKQLIYGRLYLWIKPNLYGLIFIALGIFLVIYVHNEYLNYLEIKNDNYLVGLSFIIKNILILMLVIGYLTFQLKLNKSEEKIEIKEFSNMKSNDSVSNLEYFLQDDEINK